MSPASGDGLRHLSVVNQEFASTAFDRLVRKLRAAGYLEPDEQVGDDFKVLCPIHENTGEHDPALHVTKKEDGGVLVTCFGGCDRSDVYRQIMADDAVLPQCRGTIRASGRGAGGFLISELELHPGDPEMYFRWCAQEAADGPGAMHEVAYHVYRNEEGRDVAAKIKWANSDRTHKDFTWLHKSGNRWMRSLKGIDNTVPLYRVDEIVASEGVVYAVEGEKDADRLWDDGLVATNTKLVGRSVSKIVKPLVGRTVVVIPDNDANNIGQEEARRFAVVVAKAGAREVRLMAPFGGESPQKSGYDISDWFRDGGTVGELEMMASTDELVEIIRPDQVADSGDGASLDDGADEIDDLEAEIDQLSDGMVKKQLAADRAREKLRKMQSAKGRRLDVAALLLADLPTAQIGQLVDINSALIDQGIFFSGMYNAVFGAPGYGKSWIGLLCVAQELLKGNHAVFFSYELPGAAVVDRLRRNFRVPAEVLIERLHLYDDKSVLGEDALDEVMGLNGGVAPTFMLMDSIREVLSKGSGSYADTEISKLIIDEMSAPFTKLGACVVSIDHVGHSTDERQAGSMAKGAVVQGSMYKIVRGASVPFSHGRRGYTAFKLVKNNVGRLPWEKDGSEPSFFLRCDYGPDGVGADDPMEFVLSETPLKLSTGEMVQRAAEANGAGELDEHENAIIDYVVEAGDKAETKSVRALQTAMAARGSGSGSTWKRRIDKMVDRGLLVKADDGSLSLPSLAGADADDDAAVS